MGLRFSISLAGLALTGTIGCGSGTTPFSPLRPGSAETPVPPSAPALPTLAVVPGVQLLWVGPPSGATVVVSRCQFPADVYEPPQAIATASGSVRPFHEVGDCTTTVGVKLLAQVREAALSRVQVQFVDGALAGGGTPCASASWTGMLNAGSPREFALTSFEVLCSRPHTTNRLVITLARCSMNMPYGPCEDVLVREEIPHAYMFGESF
jgi:hypothetical protein